MISIPITANIILYSNSSDDDYESISSYTLGIGTKQRYPIESKGHSEDKYLRMIAIHLIVLLQLWQFTSKVMENLDIS